MKPRNLSQNKTNQVSALSGGEQPGTHSDVKPHRDVKQAGIPLLLNNAAEHKEELRELSGLQFH